MKVKSSICLMVYFLYEYLKTLIVQLSLLADG